MSLILLAFTAIVLAYFLPRCFRFCSKVYRLYTYSKAFAGPPTQFILGNSLQVPKDSSEWIGYFNDLGNFYSKQGHTVIRFWVGHLLKIIPLEGSSLKDIFDSSVEITKGDDYEIVLPWLGTGLLLSTNEKWRQRRKMLTPSFHFAMLDGYVSVFDKQANLMTSLLEEFADTETAVDVFPYIKRCALDIICETAMGSELQAQTDPNNPYVLAVTDMSKIVTVYSLRPELWFAPIWYLTGFAKKYNKVLKVLTDFTKQVIKDRQQSISAEAPKEGRKAFLDMLIDMKGTNKLTDEDIREEVDTFMFEGHDTTSSGMSWFLWCIACHPEIQAKLADELFGIFGNSDRSCTIEDLKKMTYMELCLKEALRLRSPVPFVSRKLSNDLEIGGHIAPAGAQVLIAANMVHSNEKNWPNPGKYDPDRFLPENSVGRHPFDYIPFSAGLRNCIGQKFASYEEKVVVSWVLRKFKISTDKTFEQCPQAPEVVLRPLDGVCIKLQRRYEVDV